jgi:hypothetical protein
LTKMEALAKEALLQASAFGLQSVICCRSSSSQLLNFWLPTSEFSLPFSELWLLIADRFLCILFSLTSPQQKAYSS